MIPGRYVVEVGHSQLTKHGEELCGDSVAVTRTGRSTLAVVSDGLGSGVKASILSSVTSHMASTMLRKGASIDEVMATLAETLPVCRVRQLAYSTFTLLEVGQEGAAYLAEYDNPAAIFGRGGDRLPIQRVERTVGERVIREAVLRLGDGDWAVLITDGVLHAGIGGLWNLGWGHERVDQFVRRTEATGCSSQELADQVAALCRKLYGGKPGDDASIVCLRVRLARKLTALVGPPQDPAQDRPVVAGLLAAEGYRVVCGGTTGNLVARELGLPIEVDLDSLHARVPPLARIQGVDLVTEGMLTLFRVRELLSPRKPRSEPDGGRDAASRLVRLLLAADQIHFIVGRAINPAHQSPDVPVELALKGQIVQDIARSLRRHGKQVKIDYR